jgi:hypothetical protein
LVREKGDGRDGSYGRERCSRRGAESAEIFWGIGRSRGSVAQTILSVFRRWCHRHRPNTDRMSDVACGSVVCATLPSAPSRLFGEKGRFCKAAATPEKAMLSRFVGSWSFVPNVRSGMFGVSKRIVLRNARGKLQKVEIIFFGGRGVGREVAKTRTHTDYHGHTRTGERYGLGGGVKGRRL